MIPTLSLNPLILDNKNARQKSGLEKYPQDGDRQLMWKHKEKCVSVCTESGFIMWKSCLCLNSSQLGKNEMKSCI